MLVHTRLMILYTRHGKLLNFIEVISVIKYYAQLDVQNMCVGVSQLAGVVDADNLVELDSYDISVLGKVWQGGKWVDNPNKPTETELPPAVSNEQLRDELQAIKEESRINNEMSQSALAELLLLQAQQMEGVKGGE